MQFIYGGIFIFSCVVSAILVSLFIKAIFANEPNTLEESFSLVVIILFLYALSSCMEVIYVKINYDWLMLSIVFIVMMNVYLTSIVFEFENQLKKAWQNTLLFMSWAKIITLKE